MGIVVNFMLHCHHCDISGHALVFKAITHTAVEPTGGSLLHKIYV